MNNNDAGGGYKEDEEFNSTLETPEFTQIKLQEAKEVYNRKKEMYKISNCLIQFITALIILFIIGVAVLVLMNLTQVPTIKDIWHIYLISILALSTLLSGMIYLNKSTWSDKKEEPPSDLTTALTKFLNNYKK